jgi:rubrerythrin
MNNLGVQISNAEEYKKLVRDGKYVCKVCGRVAAKKENLCKPVDL